MSRSKLLKCLDKPVSLPSNLSTVPVIITDSKGKYLHKLKVNPTYVNKLHWHIKSGRRSQDAKEYIFKNLKMIKSKHGHIWIYLWIGTCDFTEKEGKYIYLVSNCERAFGKFKENIKKILRICSENSVKITLLHISYYSIHIWNEKRGHRSPQ